MVNDLDIIQAATEHPEYLRDLEGIASKLYSEPKELKRGVRDVAKFLVNYGQMWECIKDEEILRRHEQKVSKPLDYLVAFKGFLRDWAYHLSLYPENSGAHPDKFWHDAQSGFATVVGCLSPKE